MTPIEHIYIHTPFCKSKCKYCDFYSILADNSLMTEWIDAIHKEIELFHKNAGSISTIYFGGGTPSMMPEHFVPMTIEKFSKFGFVGEPEITAEVNPDSATQRLMKTFKNAGVNRISIGVQSLNDSHLQWLGRIHSSRSALRCVEEALNIFPKVSVDLIYGIPYQTITEFVNDISRFAQMGVKHFSLYALTIHEGNPLYEDVKKYYGDNWDEALANFWESAFERLSMWGILPYEVSNFSANGHECRHNISYWTREYYAGFGPSAHSFLPSEKENLPVRIENISDVEKYISLIKQGRNPGIREERISVSDEISEYIMLSLRMSYGIHIKKIIMYFGQHIADKIINACKNLLNTGVLETDGERIFLRNSKLLLADGVSVRILAEMESL